MAKLVDDFSDDLTYSELLWLPPKFVADVKSLSGLMVNLGDVFLTFRWSYEI